MDFEISMQISALIALVGLTFYILKRKLQKIEDKIDKLIGTDESEY